MLIKNLIRIYKFSTQITFCLKNIHYAKSYWVFFMEIYEGIKHNYIAGKLYYSKTWQIWKRMLINYNHSTQIEFYWFQNMLRWVKLIALMIKYPNWVLHSLPSHETMEKVGKSEVTLRFPPTHPKSTQSIPCPI